MSDVTYDPTQQMSVPTDQARVTTNSAPAPKFDTRTQAMIDEIKRLYPELAFFFDDEMNGFGTDVRDLLIKAVQQGYTNERVKTEYKQTKYYIETTDAAKLFDAKTKAEQQDDIDVISAEITASYGDLFDFEGGDKIAAQIARTAARLGMSTTGQRFKSFVNAEALRMKPGGIQSPTLTTTGADKIRNTLREYGYIPSEDEINAVLTGTADRKGIVLNEAALVERAKASAKALYPHLSQQLDAGLSLDDLFKNYRQYASSILELDPNGIDFVKDPKWSRAFGNSQTGPLSLSDWERELKTNKDYGWQYTNQANQQVSSVVSTLERAFGLVR
jgi:hypothetical protein